MKKVLFSLPSESLATKWASSFVKRYVVWKNLLIDRQYLGSVLARRSLFKFRAPRSDVVIAVGHGSEDELMGHGELIWKTGAYESSTISIGRFACTYITIIPAFFYGFTEFTRTECQPLTTKLFYHHIEVSTAIADTFCWFSTDGAYYVLAFLRYTVNQKILLVVNFIAVEAEAYIICDFV